MLKRTDNPYPVKVLPHADELLSSYLTRTAEAMGITLRTLCRQSIDLSTVSVSHDIDQINDAFMFRQIAHKTNCNSDFIRSLSLQSFVGTLFPRIKSKGMTSGILAKGRFLAKEQLHGVQYCPECLKENVYIRRHWRISWITVCTKHRVKLVDHCIFCKKPLVFYLLHGLGRNKACCGYCEKSILHGHTHSDVDMMVFKFTHQLETMMLSGWIEIMNHQYLFGLGFTKGLARLLTLLAINPKTRIVTETLLNKEKISFPICEAVPLKVFGQLRLDERYQALWCVSRLLKDWPANYIETIKATNLPLYTITPRLKDCYWLDSPFEWRLAKGFYKPSHFEAIQAVHYLNQSGVKLSVRKVRQLLGFCFDQEPYHQEIQDLIQSLLLNRIHP